MEKENKSEGHNESDSSSTKREVVAFLKWSLLLGCTGGFFYQIMQFLLQYYSYPMVVNIDIQRPDTFIEPSATFCYSNYVRRSLFCAKNKDKCEKPKNMNAFCDQHPHYCNADVDKDNFTLPKEEVYLYPENLTQAELDEFGSNQMHINITWAKDYPPPKIVERAFWISKTNLGSCQIVNYRVFSEKNPVVRRFTYPQTRLSAYYQTFRLTVEEDELFDPRDTPEIVLSLQSPFELPDPYIEGVRMKTGKSYEIRIHLEEEHLLESPFATACHNYTKLWEEDKSKPRSSLGCASQCLDIMTRKCNRCSSTVPTEKYEICKGRVENFCKPEEEKVVRRLYHACLPQCKIECRKFLYKFKAQEVPDKYQRTHPLGRKRETRVDFIIEEPEIRVFIHKAKYHQVELFGYIGGFMGCWLGISIWSIFYALLRIQKKLKLKEKLKKGFSFSFRDSFRSSKNKSKEEIRDVEIGENKEDIKTKA